MACCSFEIATVVILSNGLPGLDLVGLSWPVPPALFASLPANRFAGLVMAGALLPANAFPGLVMVMVGALLASLPANGFPVLMLVLVLLPCSTEVPSWRLRFRLY